jgi:3-phenylpropionate/trans-cinnamate dioxygenase ferredoxin reductase subunit
MTGQTFAILGAGVAAANAAEALRTNGFDGRIFLIGRETDPPYNRPALSKERLRGEAENEAVPLHPPEYYQEQNITLLLNHTVVRLDVRSQEVHLSNGEAIRYDKALVATGSTVRAFPDGHLDGIYYLRSLHDCRLLHDALAKRPRVLVLGTGFIGCEVAASARKMGCEVTLAGRKPPLAHVLGAEIGNAYAEYHRSQGVNVKSDAGVEGFEGSGRLERAKLSDGSTIDCDVAVIGIGVTPALDILQGQPLDMQDGVLVDEFCRSSVPNVYAAGDVARFKSGRFGTHMRVEHFDNARLQATAAAKAMLGGTDAYDPIPSFWSDQFSYGLQYRGYAPSWDTLVTRGSLEQASFSAFYLTGGKLQAVCSVNRYKENSAARKLIGQTVDAQTLADDNVDLKEFAAQQA